MSKVKIFIQLQDSINKGDFAKFKKIWQESLDDFLAEEVVLFNPLNQPFVIEGEVFAPLFFSAIKGPNLAIAEFLLNLQGEDFAIPSVDLSMRYPVEVTSAGRYEFSFENRGHAAPRLALCSEKNANEVVSVKSSPTIKPLTLAISHDNFKLAEQLLKQCVKKLIAIDARNEDFFLSPLYEAMRADYQPLAYEFIENGNTHSIKENFISLLLSPFSDSQVKNYIFYFVDHYLKDFSEKDGKELAQCVCSYFRNILEKTDPDDAKLFIERINTVLLRDEPKLEKTKENNSLNNNVVPQLDMALVGKIEKLAGRKVPEFKNVLVKGKKTLEYKLLDVAAEDSVVIFQPCALTNALNSDLFSLTEVIQAFENNLRQAQRDQAFTLKNTNYTLFLPFIHNEPDKVFRFSLAEITLDAIAYPEKPIVKTLQIYSDQDFLKPKSKKEIIEIAAENTCHYDPQKNCHEYKSKVNFFHHIFYFIFFKLAEVLGLQRSNKQELVSSLDELVEKSGFEKLLPSLGKYPGSARPHDSFFTLDQNSNPKQQNAIIEKNAEGYVVLSL